MPELPEVEVTRRQIEPLLVGRRISGVRTTRPSYFYLTPPARLRRELRSRRMQLLLRRGKYLVAELDNGARLLLHLGMTGQLFSSAATSPRLLSSSAAAALGPADQRSFRPDRHTHLQLRFDDEGPDVYFRDVRKFGKVELLRPGERAQRLERLGVDALEASGEQLFRQARRRTLQVKNLLLNQRVIAGIGNIYADEALFAAGIRPTRRAGRLTRSECERIVVGLQEIMHRSIESGGTTIRDFVAPDGSDGGYQDDRKVYARTGEPCRRCSTPIRRTVIGQRSTHFCPRCQA